MPQLDRRGKALVPLEFNTMERFDDLPQEDRITLVLVTDGKANMVLNGEPLTIHSPSVLCLSQDDRIEAINCSLLYAQSFSLSPSFMKSRTTFRQVKGKLEISDDIEFTQDTLWLFYTRNQRSSGVLSLPPQAGLKLFEWLSIIGTEINAQSDGRWTCRVRRYFLSILNVLDELYEAKETAAGTDSLDSPVDTVLEYIHIHYMEGITLGACCGMTHINRTTLGKMFKKRTGQSIIDYLLSYRLRIARELLAHTGLTIDEIARSSGFVYDTYLIRQFTAKYGIAPTKFRKYAKEKYGIVIPPKT